ncbi:hypothetical protein [Spirosoma endophyticum]|uniref:Uncharacterized protein n=1 Tax=Spirosoma endophyticum TaxID=662367 RepID=A0A1I1MRX7_9BACT|nr:hypothetical protein [Spirosoma endophyticum]SFC87915.1 hypothetical protein SAMN05216167_102680 [Spirosoma endophyticum]
MILFVNGVNDGISCTDVGFWVSDHESAFEQLTQLVADDWVLQEATVVDGADRLTVPIDAFDGQPIQVHIRALQRQWQLLLSSQPLPPNRLCDQQLKSWYMQLEAYYDDMLTYLGKMISMLEMRKTLLATYSDEFIKTRLGRQCKALLDINRRMFKQIKASRQKNRLRLSQIEDE